MELLEKMKRPVKNEKFSIRLLAILLLSGIMALTLQGCGSGGKKVVLTISAASSLTNALNRVKTAYEAEKPGVTVQYNFGASGALEQQILQGAGADIFISAASKQMDELESRKLLLDGTRVDLLGNSLVLIVPAGGESLSGGTGISGGTDKSNGSDKSGGSDIKDFTDLLKADVKKIAVGEPKTVPAGQYAQEVFTKLGILDAVKSKLVYANNVRQALIWVETGDAGASVVYKTDALTSKKVRIAANAPEGSHRPIVYPAAVIAASKVPAAAKDFMKYLSNSKANSIFEVYGFTIPENKH